MDEDRIEELNLELDGIISRIRQLESLSSDPEAYEEEIQTLSDLLDTRMKELEFAQGLGEIVKLRVVPPPWADPDPRKWNWKELLDMDTVECLEGK